jgi:exopolysaccharide production negative regulator
MRISSGIIAAGLIAWAGLVHAQQSTAPAPDAAAQAALERGLDALRTGKHDAAISALGSAAAMGDSTTGFIAEFYLARVYAADAGPATDHTKAFVLYRKLADENLTVDPLTSQRAPFVAKALIALAGYVRAGVKEIDLAPNPRRAADYLYHAAVFFGDRDAQLELAKIYLGSDSSSDDVRRGLHYLAVLAEESHGTAQAVLADLFWRGRHVAKDPRRALALATMAVENAPQHERIWVEEGYATIFCATNQIVRAEAGVLVARWRQAFLRPGGAVTRTGSFEMLPERQCSSGERVALSPPGGASKVEVVAGSETAIRPATAESLKTTPAPVGFKAAGIVEAATAKK